MAAVAQAEAIVIPLSPPPRRTPLPVSPAMLDAGRVAFLRHRRALDDLFNPFPSDRDSFIRAIYRAMAAAGAD